MLRLEDFENLVFLDPPGSKEEMKKLIELYHERNKRALNLIIFILKEEVFEDTLAIAQT